MVLSVQHSGSVRYYANRITLRYDWLPPDQLDAAVRDLTAKGYQPYLVVDDWEQKEFQTRFGPASALGKLDWPPVARVPRAPSANLPIADGGPGATKKSSLVFLAYCAITIALTYPLVVTLERHPNDPRPR